MKFPFAPSIAVACCLAAVSHAATTVTFDGLANGPISSTLASNVPDVGGVPGTSVSSGQGTPNIALNWRGFTIENDMACAPSPMAGIFASITFTPDAGYAVNLGSLGFQATQPYDIGNPPYVCRWWISDSSTQVATGTVSFTAGGALVTAPFNFTGEEGVSYDLQLEIWSKSFGRPIYFDNLIFSQTSVPEPSASALLLLLGAAGLLRRRRRA